MFQRDRKNCKIGSLQTMYLGSLSKHLCMRRRQTWDENPCSSLCYKFLVCHAEFLRLHRNGVTTCDNAVLPRLTSQGGEVRVRCFMQVATAKVASQTGKDDRHSFTALQEEGDSSSLPLPPPPPRVGDAGAALLRLRPSLSLIITIWSFIMMIPSVRRFNCARSRIDG